MQFSQVVKRNILFISQHIKHLFKHTTKEAINERELFLYFNTVCILLLHSHNVIVQNKNISEAFTFHLFIHKFVDLRTV